MSYSGTVYCGYCGAKGHNKLGCPARKAAAEENPDSYTGRQIKREQRERQEMTKNRKCSYCREGGHNRRGCKILKEDKSTLLTDVAHYRMKFLSAMKDAGLGIGALVSAKWKEHREEEVVHMVMSVNWDIIDMNMMKGLLHPASYQKYIVHTILANVPLEYEATGYYDRPPVVGKKSSLSTLSIAGCLEDVFDIPEKVYGGYGHGDMPYEQFASKILNRSDKINEPAGWLNPSELCEELAGIWNIVPDKYSSDDSNKIRMDRMWQDRQACIDTTGWI